MIQLPEITDFELVRKIERNYYIVIDEKKYINFGSIPSIIAVVRNTDAYNKKIKESST